MKKIKSKFNFDDTFKKLKEKIEEKNLLVFYITDHRQNAIDSDLELEKTKVIFFGNPKVGTYLIEDNPEISYELPLRISIFSTESEVYMFYKEPTKHLSEYNLGEKSKEILEKMDKLYKTLIEDLI